MDRGGTHQYVAAILNAGWMVRHYARGGRWSSGPIVESRAAAIKALGLIVRQAFELSDDFEPLLAAVVDALRPRDEPPF